MTDLKVLRSPWMITMSRSLLLCKIKSVQPGQVHGRLNTIFIVWNGVTQIVQD